MMKGLALDAGQFRNCNEGVFSGSKCVHLAPPPDRVPGLMKDLFDWLKNSKEHLLVRSCVFHYEFEFIHPFSDGNGRTGRLWQSLILGKLNPAFEFLPVENMVYANQCKYYDAIAKSTKAGESTPFVEFMLQNILATLKKYKNATLAGAGDKAKLTTRQETIIKLIQAESATTEILAKKLKVSARTIARDLSALQELGIIVHDGSRKTGRWLVK